MSLLEKLAERQYEFASEKVAEDLFVNAVADELQKLGYDISEEMLKEAQLGSALKKIVGKAGKLFGKKPSSELQIMKAMQKARKAGVKLPKRPSVVMKKTIGKKPPPSGAAAGRAAELEWVRGVKQ